MLLGGEAILPTFHCFFLLLDCTMSLIFSLLFLMENSFAIGRFCVWGNDADDDDDDVQFEHRFAAKEAAIKAHSHRRLTFHDVVIERRGRNEERLGSGPPVARIKGRGGEDGGEDASAMISISHDGDYATAVCMAHDPSVVGGGEC